jgi:cell division protein FtsL
MQVPRYWRMKQHLYRLQGYTQEVEETVVEQPIEKIEQKAVVIEATQPKREHKIATVA